MYQPQRVVIGNFHQGNSMFQYAGVQCTAIAMFALATIFLSSSSLHTHLDNWGTNDIDNIIWNGNYFYERLLTERQLAPYTQLLHSELPDEMYIHGNRIRSRVYHDIFYGLATYTTSTDESFYSNAGDVSLYNAIATGFQISNFMLITFDSYTIAVFQYGNNIYVFDSHALNFDSVSHESGSSSMLEFGNLQHLYTYLLTNFEGSLFNLSPVVFENNFVEQNTEISDFRLHSERNIFQVHEQSDGSLCQLHRSAGHDRRNSAWTGVSLPIVGPNDRYEQARSCNENIAIMV